MKIRLVPQISLFLKNKPGVMAEIAVKLAKKKVNILGLSIDESTDWGVFRIIVNSLDRAKRALHSFGPKALMVNVNYAYASGQEGETALYLAVNDIKKAIRVLG